MEPSIVGTAAPLTVTLALMAAALMALAVLLRAARGHHVSIHSLMELEGRTRPVDLAAFRNLVDAEDEEFLRQQLVADEFRKIQRERMRAAAEYVARTAHNAAILISLGETVQRQPDPQLAEAGRELVNAALRLRINAFLALVVLCARTLFPEARTSVTQLADAYQGLTERVVRLTRLQNPAYAARISAVI